ncbi:MAG: glycosyltransferase family 1 protein [Rikenellaceae bacterium]|nr:glycosyltransferase family 1 protein [Rikenellaceae bacterium]
MKTIVISAVNLRKGGTLTILRQCLAYLSSVAEERRWRIVALVHRRTLCDYPHIEYIEMPDVAKGWLRRLWCEYVTMHGISKRLGRVDLWFSLHDTTPRVQAERQAVYCQTSFPFLKWRWSDWFFDPKIALFALFTRFAYLVNSRRNRYFVVQTAWLRRSFAALFSLPESRFVVAPPTRDRMEVTDEQPKPSLPTFFYPATPDCHKNFETLCRAAERLEGELGRGKFRVEITLSGDENRYARWLHKRWGSLSSIAFVGFLSREELFRRYAASSALIFPSRVETWGLPISEFAPYGKPMVLADLPYAYEAAAGHAKVALFDPSDAEALAASMGALIRGDYSAFRALPKAVIEAPFAPGWDALFRQLLV